MVVFEGIGVEVHLQEEVIKRCIMKHLDWIDDLVINADDNTWLRWKSRRGVVKDRCSEEDDCLLVDYQNAQSNRETKRRFIGQTRAKHLVAQNVLRAVKRRRAQTCTPYSYQNQSRYYAHNTGYQQRSQLTTRRSQPTSTTLMPNQRSAEGSIYQQHNMRLQPTGVSDSNQTDIAVTTDIAVSPLDNNIDSFSIVDSCGGRQDAGQEIFSGTSFVSVDKHEEENIEMIADVMQPLEILPESVECLPPVLDAVIKTEPLDIDDIGIKAEPGQSYSMSRDGYDIEDNVGQMLSQVLLPGNNDQPKPDGRYSIHGPPPDVRSETRSAASSIFSESLMLRCKRVAPESLLAAQFSSRSSQPSLTSSELVLASMNGGCEQQDFACRIKGCGKVLSSMATLKRHHEHVHLHQEPYICQLCGRGLSRKDHLKRHLQGVHKLTL